MQTAKENEKRLFFVAFPFSFPFEHITVHAHPLPPFLPVCVQSECENHTRRGAISVFKYYGGERVQDWRQTLKHDVVITTYGTLQSEYKVSLSECSGLGGDWEDAVPGTY